MTSLSTLMILMMMVSLMFTLAAHMLPKRKKDNEKNSPYECGFDPLKSARLPFSFRFFLVAILFLLFDLEMALLFPLPMAMPMASPNLTITTSSAFMIILTIGLMFEWVKGGLEWAE